MSFITNVDGFWDVITARKRSLRRLCFHRCLSVHRQTLGRQPPRVDTPSAQCMLGYDQQMGGTHPTGMHSSLCKGFAAKTICC